MPAKPVRLANGGGYATQQQLDAIAFAAGGNCGQGGGHPGARLIEGGCCSLCGILANPQQAADISVVDVTRANKARGFRCCGRGGRSAAAHPSPTVGAPDALSPYTCGTRPGCANHPSPVVLAVVGVNPPTEGECWSAPGGAFVDCIAQSMGFRDLVDEARTESPRRTTGGNRHGAYAKFVRLYLAHGGAAGKGEPNPQVAIPCCCLGAVRATIPAINGLYSGQPNVV